MNLSLGRKTGQIQTIMSAKNYHLILPAAHYCLLHTFNYTRNDFYKNQSLPNFNTSRKAF